MTPTYSTRNGNWQTIFLNDKIEVNRAIGCSIARDICQKAKRLKQGKSNNDLKVKNFRHGNFSASPGKFATRSPKGLLAKDVLTLIALDRAPQELQSV